MIRYFIEELRRRLVEPMPLVQVLLGPRQVGKTYGVKQLLESWKGPKRYETADLLSPPSQDWIVSQWKLAEQSGPGTLLVIDEIQKIPGWSEAIKFLFDKIRGTLDLKVVLLGSASLSLQEGLADSLVGRYELVRAPHWNFEETRGLLPNMDLDHYLLFGGYPDSLRFVDDIDRWQNFLQFSVIEPVLTRDIQGTRRISKPALFRRAFELLMQYPAHEISLQKLLGQLQDKGNTTTIKHYIELFEGAFLLKQLQKYSKNELRKKASSPKIIPMSTSLSNAFMGMTEFTDFTTRGHFFEAAVGANLSTFPGKLSYWRSGDYELDFVWEHNRKTYAIEVKSGRNKRSDSLGKFLTKYPESIPIIIDTDNVGELFTKGPSFFDSVNK